MLKGKLIHEPDHGNPVGNFLKLPVWVFYSQICQKFIDLSVDMGTTAKVVVEWVCDFLKLSSFLSCLLYLLMRIPFFSIIFFTFPICFILSDLQVPSVVVDLLCIIG